MIKNLSIPKKGTEMMVAEDWLITIHPGIRNIPIGVAIGKYHGDEHAGHWFDGEHNLGYHPYNITPRGREYHKTFDIIIEKDTVLIFRGSKYSDSYSNDDSVMFTIKNGKYEYASFWVTIDQANNLKYI